MDDAPVTRIPDPDIGDRSAWILVGLLALVGLMVVFGLHAAGARPVVTLVVGAATLGPVTLVILACFAPAPLTLRRVVVRRRQDLRQVDVPVFGYQVDHEGQALAARRAAVAALLGG